MSKVSNISLVQLQLTEDEAAIVRSALLVLNWGHFPAAEEIADGLSDSGIGDIDLRYNEDSGELERA